MTSPALAEIVGDGRPVHGVDDFAAVDAFELDAGDAEACWICG
jgi:hypothetical protein